jgi:ankyrin repeat protein
MKRRALRILAFVLVVVGIGILARNFDDAHWWLARKFDDPRLYSWHAYHTCRYSEEARQRHHDGVWARVLEDRQDMWLHEYLTCYAEGPHAEEARVRADDRYWRIALERGEPGTYVSYYPAGRHVEEAKASAFESAWSKAEESPTIQAYEAYLAVAPEAPRAVEARERIEELTWREVRSTAFEHVVVDYLRTRPDGPHAAEARVKLDDVRYEQSLVPGSDEVAGLLAYLRVEPEGRHAAEALARLEAPLAERSIELLEHPERAGWALTSQLEGPHGPALDPATGCVLAYLRWFPRGARAAELRARLEPNLWSRAVATEDPALYALYRDACPEGPHVEAARTAAEGEDLSQLVARGSVIVEALGANITSVGARLTWVAPDAAPTADDGKVSDGVTVRVPAGSYFAAGAAGVQNMLAYRTTRVRLHRGMPSARPVLEVVCANKSLAIPTDQHGMSFAGPAPSADLVRVARVLEETQAPYAVAQAATWIVSDDANVAGLGTLVWQSGVLTTGSVIQLGDMGRALELCSRAGVDLRTRAIWQDRFALRAHVGPELRATIGAPETLEQAARYGSAQEFEALLDGSVPSWEILFPVLERDDESLVRALARAVPDAADLLRLALRIGRGRWAPFLVELGADPLAPDPESGETPLDLAAGAGDFAAMAFLLERGADLEDRGAPRTPLWHAAAAGNVDAVRELLARGAKVDGGDETALMAAVGHLEVVRLLLEHGADVGRTTRDPEARTALACALERDFGTEQVVELLLARGADPELGTAERSPLQLAAEHGRLDAARLLLAAGAQAANRPAGTPTPLELARSRLAQLEDDAPFMEWEAGETRALIELLEE